MSFAGIAIGIGVLFIFVIYLTRYYYRDLLLGPAVDFEEDGYIKIGLYPKNYEAVLVLTCDDVNVLTKPHKVENLLNTVNKYGVKVVFFIIPFFKGRYMITKDSEIVAYLKKAKEQGHEIGMHGLTHSSPTRPLSLRRAKEFGFLPYSEQKRRIKKGKRIIEQAGFDIVGFRSPAFSASIDTLRILDSEDFLYSSDTRVTPLLLMSNKRFAESLYYPYHPKGLSILDFTTNGDYFWGYSKLGKGDLEGLKRRFNRFYENRGCFVLLSHIEPINSGSGLKILEQFLEYASTKNVWKPTLKELGEWWNARESLFATTEIKEDTLVITLDKDSELPLNELPIKFKPDIPAKYYRIQDANEVVLKEGKISEGIVFVNL